MNEQAIASQDAENIFMWDYERRIRGLEAQLAEAQRERNLPVSVMRLIAENKKLRAALEEREEVLRDCWNQFAIERLDGTTWAGGLSTLEEVERVLALSPQPDGDRTAHERITSVYTERDELKVQLAEAQRERELAESHLEARESLLSELEWGNHQKKAETDNERLRAVLEGYANEKNWEVADLLKRVQPVYTWQGDNNPMEIAQLALKPRGEGEEWAKNTGVLFAY